MVLPAAGYTGGGQFQDILGGITMKKFNRAIAVASMASLALFAAPTMNASAAGQAAAGDAIVTHCTEMLGDPDPVTGVRAVASQTCEQMTTAERDAEVADTSTAGRGITAITLIVLFQDLNRTGNSSAISVSGSECDSAGYQFTPSSFWKTNVSSLGQGNSTCNRALLTNIALNNSTNYVVPTNGIGIYNDNVGFMNVKKV